MPDIGTGIGMRVNDAGSIKWSSYCLKLTFDDIANVPVADASSVSDWNTFFDLPTYGTPFTEVLVDGNVVTLRGGAGIKLKDRLFRTYANPYLISIVDNNCITSAGTEVFQFQTSLSTVVLPTILTIGTHCFNSCTSLVEANFPLLRELPPAAFLNCPSLADVILPECTYMSANDTFGDCASLETLYLPKCTTIGGLIIDPFRYVSGCVIDLTIPLCLTTQSGGDYHVALLNLLDDNIVTVTTTTYDPEIFTIKMTFETIAATPVLDPTDLNDWINFFGIYWGNSFTEVRVNGNEVTLVGGNNIYIDNNLFLWYNYPWKLVSFIDSGCIIWSDFPMLNNNQIITAIELPSLSYIGDSVFSSCIALEEISLPRLEIAKGLNFIGCSSLQRILLPWLDEIGDNEFSDCADLVEIEIPVCRTLGSSFYNNHVFDSISGNTITLTCSVVIQLDGDVLELIANNNVTLISTYTHSI